MNGINGSVPGDILRSRVLLVEEDAAVAGLVHSALEQAGMVCEHAATAPLGMQMFRAHEPHLVLLSLGLPNLGGVVLCPQIRAASTIPVVILSLRTRREDQMHALNMGADDFITLRPPDEQLMMARLLTLLRRVYVYNQSAATTRAALSGQILREQPPAGWDICANCRYMGPAHRFERLDAAARKIIMCPHCNSLDCLRSKSA